MDSPTSSSRLSFAVFALVASFAASACSSKFTPEPTPSTGGAGSGTSGDSASTGGSDASGTATEVSIDNAYFTATDSSLEITFTFNIPEGRRIDRADRFELMHDSGTVSVSEDFCFARSVIAGRSKPVTITLEPDAFGDNGMCELTDSYGCGANATKAFACPTDLTVGTSVGITVGGLYEDGSPWSASATAVPR